MYQAQFVRIELFYSMEILDYILHIDVYLQQLLEAYPGWFYAILFVIIFMETGLVVLPFLPGDSLLFATGVLAAKYPTELNIWIALALLFSAAVIGDTVNYSIGKYFGSRLTHATLLGHRLIKDEHIAKTQDFFHKYGSKTIVIARFVPIVRTLAPFVAGFSSMHYSTFIRYNMVGGFLWVFGITLMGYFFGNFPFVQQNFEFVVLGIIGFSLLPIVIEGLKAKFKK